MRKLRGCWVACCAARLGGAGGSDDDRDWISNEWERVFERFLVTFGNAEILPCELGLGLPVRWARRRNFGREVPTFAKVL